MPTEFDDGDSIDTNSQGTLILGTTGMSGTARVVRLNDAGELSTVSGDMAPPNWSTMAIGYNSSNCVTSVVYSVSGTTHSTIALAYDGALITNVVRTYT